MRITLIAIILGVLVISSSQAIAADQNAQSPHQATPSNSMSTFA